MSNFYQLTAQKDSKLRKSKLPTSVVNERVSLNRKCEESAFDLKKYFYDIFLL